jgi:hypothetical protein
MTSVLSELVRNDIWTNNDPQHGKLEIDESHKNDFLVMVLI